MGEKEINELIDKIDKALKISSEKMIQTKKRLGQKLVISENGVIKIVKPT